MWELLFEPKIMTIFGIVFAAVGVTVYFAWRIERLSVKARTPRKAMRRKEYARMYLIEKKEWTAGGTVGSQSVNSKKLSSTFHKRSNW